MGPSNNSALTEGAGRSRGPPVHSKNGQQVDHVPIRYKTLSGS